MSLAPPTKLRAGPFSWSSSADATSCWNFTGFTLVALPVFFSVASRQFLFEPPIVPPQPQAISFVQHHSLEQIQKVRREFGLFILKKA